MRIFGIFTSILLLIQAATFAPGLGFAQSSQNPNDGSRDNTSYIGVLAFRGIETANNYWQPLAEYLTHSIAGKRFELIPVTLNSAYQHIERKNIDFIITNPGHYVALANRFGLSAISTRERVHEGAKGNLLEFGSVIFVRQSSDINGLDGLKGATIAAVSPDAFGGFQIAWAEMDAQGISVPGDLKGVRYMGFPQDAIVSAVLNDEVDAGIVRTGLLELLAKEGKLNIDNVRVLNANTQFDHPYLVSSRLYPEWPFAVLPGVESTLKISVLKSLLNTQNREIAEKHKLTDIWSTPLSYNQVRILIDRYNDRTRQATAFGVSFFGLNGARLFTIFTAAAGITGFLFYRRFRYRTVPQINQVANGNNHPDLSDLAEKFETLTRREREILTLVCTGLPSKAIAQQLHISIKTVEFHRTNLLQKTEAGTTAHLVQMATRLNMDQGFPLG